MMARSAVQEMKEEGLSHNSIGFVATVLRDNELDDDLHAFYQLVMDYSISLEQEVRDQEKAIKKAEQAERAKIRAKERRKEKAEEKKKNSL